MNLIRLTSQTYNKIQFEGKVLNGNETKYLQLKAGN